MFVYILFVFVRIKTNIIHSFIFINADKLYCDCMKLNNKTKKAGLYISSIATIIIIVIGIYTTGLLHQGAAQPDLPTEHLFVDATYLLKTDETNETVNVTCTPYLTNIWEEESGEITAIAYVIESNTNLAVYKNTINIGTITGDSTAEIEIPIVLSNNSYKVDILIFENGKLVLKGQITINAYPIYLWDDINHQMIQQWGLSNAIGEFRSIHQ